MITMLAGVLLMLCPKPAWTPGAVFPTVAAKTVCGSGYAGKVRHVDDATKRRVCKRYSAEFCPGANWEIDHLVPLSLGGDNDDLNLWPQPITEARVKDKFENDYHRRVCAGTMTLAEAQLAIVNCPWQ